MEKPELLISTLINHHFCIRNSKKDSVLKILKVSFFETISFNKGFDWDFLFGREVDEIKTRFLLFDEINDWTYLRWNVWDFEETIKMAQYLSESLKTQVYYFFIDPWIATCRWVLAHEGKIVRTYYESHGQLLSDEGDFETERLIVEENDFWEEKFWRLYRKICQPIDIINEREEIIAVKGELN